MYDKDSSGRIPRRRRSKDPRRKQDPERSRRQILAAAAREFSSYGYEAARVVRIAAEAGVSHQLITYHFGGKRGLFDALGPERLDRIEELSGSEPLARIIKDFVSWSIEDTDWVRTLVRETLDGDFPIADERVAGLLEVLDRTRGCQGYDEIDSGFDPGVVTLALMAACMAPAILPALARSFVGLDPGSAEFSELYACQLGRVVAALGRWPALGNDGPAGRAQVRALPDPGALSPAPEAD